MNRSMFRLDAESIEDLSIGSAVLGTGGGGDPHIGKLITIEAINRYETYLINLASQAKEMLGRVDEPNVFVHLDTYHMNIEERDVAAAIERAAGRVHHVQVCANDRGAPGADHLDWLRIVTSLGKSGYSGPLVIESFTADNASIATAASVWRPLAASQDAIAVDGLSFLRSLQSSLPPEKGAAVD